MFLFREPRDVRPNAWALVLLMLYLGFLSVLGILSGRLFLIRRSSFEVASRIDKRASERSCPVCYLQRGYNFAYIHPANHLWVFRARRTADRSLWRSRTFVAPKIPVLQLLILSADKHAVPALF